jgi:hypothetical protein
MENGKKKWFWLTTGRIFDVFLDALKNGLLLE